MIVRKDAFVFRSFFGAIFGASIVSALVISLLGYAVFTSSELAKVILLELADFLDFLYAEGADEQLLEQIQGVIEQFAELALFLYGVWYAFPLFFKTIIAQILLCLMKWETLSQYLTIGYLLGALFGMRALFSEQIEQVSETESEIMFSAFSQDGPALAASLAIVWFFAYDKR